MTYLEVEINQNKINISLSKIVSAIGDIVKYNGRALVSHSTSCRGIIKGSSLRLNLSLFEKVFF